jgi:hypothetical protein
VVNQNKIRDKIQIIRDNMAKLKIINLHSRNIIPMLFENPLK